MIDQRQIVTISIDGVERRAVAGEMLIKAAQDEGTYIPRFCWHERMKPVGMCRMCLVQIDSPRGPLMVTACTTPVAEQMAVATKGEAVEKAQEAVLEFLLANHPLDCPVCDKGGECPLQDQAMSHGPGESRFVEIKRNYEKPIPISDLVLLDRERCILCARCTRFADEISGDPLIEFKDRGNTTEVSTFPDHPFSSYFSGNTVQICPVGALTAKPYRFRARPWDLEMVESSSLYDTAHPRIEIHSSQNEIVRLTGVDNDATNHGWLSDKDRFGFEYLRSEDRITSPMVRRSGELVVVGWPEALDIVANRLDLLREEDGGQAIGVIGGAQGTNEDAYALSKFARVSLGTNNVDARLDDALTSHFLAATVDRALISDLDSADTIVVWGPDLKEEHPTLYLRVRRAAQDLGADLVVIHPRATGLDDVARHKLTYRPGRGFALLDEIAAGEHPDVAHAMSADKVVALVGVASLADGPQLAESAAALVRQKAGRARLLPLNGRSNTYGALDMGLAPDLLPGRVMLGTIGCANLAARWGEIPTTPGADTRGILEALAAGDIRALILVGADPLTDVPERSIAVEALEAAEYVVAVDLFLNESNSKADVILPAAAFSEKSGTVTNVEGRVQKVSQICPPPGQARPDWAILDDIATHMGRPIGLASAGMIAEEVASVAPAYEGVGWDVLEWEERDGVVVPLSGSQALNHVPVALAGRSEPTTKLSLHVARTMYDDGARLRHSPSLHHLAPGPVVHINPEDASAIGAFDGARVSVSTNGLEAVLSTVLDVRTPPGTIYVPFNQPGGSSLGTDAAVEVSVVGT